MPDLILLDVMMPDMSGYDVCSLIKSDEAFADIPVIFLTAVDTRSGEFRGLELGGIDYLSKPVNTDLLKLRVRNHVAVKKRNDKLRKQLDILERQKEELEATLAQVRQMEEVIPVCVQCKKIMDDKTQGGF
jgi:putative two-component system response regulator